MYFPFILTPRHTVLFFLWLDYLWEQHLRARQYKKALFTKDPPKELSNVAKKSYDQARSHMLERKRFAFIKDLCSITTSTIIIFYQIFPFVWAQVNLIDHLDEIVQNLLWYLLFTTSLSVFKLPLTLYEIFVIESNRGKRKNEILVWEKLKSFIWSQFFLTAISFVVVMIIQKGDHFLFGSWMTLCATIFIVGITYPTIAPSRFRKLKPLPDGDLRRDIVNLAKQLNFSLKEIYVEERFKRTMTDNIYFYGGSNRRSIVIDHFLLSKDDLGCNNEEVLALLANQFARWYHNHSLKYLLALEVNLFVSFFIFFIFFKNPEVYKVFGFDDIRPILVGVYVVLKYVMTFSSTLLSCVFMSLSRNFVKRDDEFVVKLGKGEALISGLMQLEKNNPTFPVYDHLYSVWHHDKPPLLERIDYIRQASELKFN